MKIAYFDAPSGISGDMTVGALLDAARPADGCLERMQRSLALLPVGGYRLVLEPVQVGGLTASSFDVIIDDAPKFHRDWRTIRAMIESAGRSGLAEGVVDRAIRIFTVLAEAEAKVHEVEPEAVHFHEVGAIDSIVDIVATAWCLDELGVDTCFVGALPSGSGFVDTEHGRLAVPAPATAELLRGFDVLMGDGEGELVTPTGAAILHALAKPLRPLMTVERIGSGAGTMRLADRANVLRVFIGEADADADREVIVVEADVDDMTPAALAHVADRLRAGGARDVSVVPSIMKKGRVAMRLTVLCDLDRLDGVAKQILDETSTIGLRYRAMARHVLPRRIDSIETDYGVIQMKIVTRPSGAETAEPEFEDLARAARDHDVAITTVRDAALVAYENGVRSH